jgi:hypothetical protein
MEDIMKVLRAEDHVQVECGRVEVLGFIKNLKGVYIEVFAAIYARGAYVITAHETATHVAVSCPPKTPEECWHARGVLIPGGVRFISPRGWCTLMEEDPRSGIVVFVFPEGDKAMEATMEEVMANLPTPSPDDGYW